MSLSKDIVLEITEEMNKHFDIKKVDTHKIEEIHDSDLRQAVAALLLLHASPAIFLAEALDVDVENFAYGTPTTTTLPTQQLGASSMWSNGTDLADSLQNQFSNSSTASFTWTVSEGLQVGVSAKYTAGLPAALGAQVTVSVQLSFQASESKTTSTTQSWSILATINIPPESVVTAAMLLEQETLDVPWSATCAIDRGDKISHHDFDRLLEGLFPGKTLTQLLPASLAAQAVSGTLGGVYGTSTTITTTQSPLQGMQAASARGQPRYV